MPPDPVIRLAELVAGDTTPGTLHAMSRELLHDVSATLATYRPTLRLDRLCEAAPPPIDQRERVEALARVREAATMMREQFFRDRAA